MKLKNWKISLVTYPDFVTIYLYVGSTLYKKRKEKKIMEYFFQNFGLSSYAENDIYAFLFQKWLQGGPSYMRPKCSTYTFYATRG